MRGWIGGQSERETVRASERARASERERERERDRERETERERQRQRSARHDTIFGTCSPLHFLGHHDTHIANACFNTSRQGGSSRTSILGVHSSTRGTSWATFNEGSHQVRCPSTKKCSCSCRPSTPGQTDSTTGFLARFQPFNAGFGSMGHPETPHFPNTIKKARANRVAAHHGPTTSRMWANKQPEHTHTRKAPRHVPPGHSLKSPCNLKLLQLD